MTACAFTDALSALAPTALVIQRRERLWCSATFVGKRMTLDLLWQGTDGAMQDFLRQLPDHEFRLSGMVVADIVGAQQGSQNGHAVLAIEALLLRDDD